MFCSKELMSYIQIGINPALIAIPKRSNSHCHMSWILQQAWEYKYVIFFSLHGIKGEPSFSALNFSIEFPYICLNHQIELKWLYICKKCIKVNTRPSPSPPTPHKKTKHYWICQLAKRALRQIKIKNENSLLSTRNIVNSSVIILFIAVL